MQGIVRNLQEQCLLLSLALGRRQQRNASSKSQLLLRCGPANANSGACGTVELLALLANTLLTDSPHDSIG